VIEKETRATCGHSRNFMSSGRKRGGSSNRARKPRGEKTSGKREEGVYEAPLSVGGGRGGRRRAFLVCDDEEPAAYYTQLWRRRRRKKLDLYQKKKKRRWDKRGKRRGKVSITPAEEKGIVEPYPCPSDSVGKRGEKARALRKLQHSKE